MSQKKKNKKIKINLKKIVLFTLMFVVLGVFLAAGASAGYVAALLKGDPVRSAAEIQNLIFKNNLTGFAYFSNTLENGSPELIGNLRADEDRRFVQYNEIPVSVYNAFLAIEDREFEEHFGVNLKSFTRAVIQELLNSEVKTGGSTITQQLAKITFFSFEKSKTRKFREIFLAMRIERILSKEDIFTAYINKIPFGKAANLNNVYGIQAAAKGFFNKDAKDLNLAESAYLAGLPQRPSAYSAFNTEGFDEEGYQLAKERQELVLARMLEEQFISLEEYNEALAYDIKASFSPYEKKAYVQYPFLMLEIENRAAEQLLEIQGVTPEAENYRELLENAKLEILTGGYKVYTSVDKYIYEAMNSVAKNPDNFNAPVSYKFPLGNGQSLELENQLEEVGATLIDNKTGAILGFVGGRDFNLSQVNHSNFRGTGKRQPGSAIKPLLDYGPALDLGKIQPATPIDDTPLGLSWEPDNWNYKYNGRLTAREALKWSFNIPAVKVFDMVGQKEAYNYFTKLGFNVDQTWFMQAGLTPAIGTIETSPEEMTSAYTTFANGGINVESYLIDKIIDKDGNVIYQHQANPEVVFSEQTAYLITDMMRSVVNGGTGSTVKQYAGGRDVAGKTGTTNDSKDLWFVGYTPEVTLGVWIGYNYPYTLKTGSIASHIWGKILAEVTNADPELSPKDSQFVKPAGIVQMEVSSTSGLLPSDLTKESGYLVTDIFNKNFIPTGVDDSLAVAKVVTYDGIRYLAQPDTPEDMVKSGIFYQRDPYELPPDLDKNGREQLDTNGKVIKKPRPVDYDKELPNEIDPRAVAEGLVPPPPSNLEIKLMGYKNVISWDKVIDENIVGYRVYRSGTSNYTFSKVGVFLQTNLEVGRPYVESTISSSIPSIYYVTTVYVNGTESSPSKLVGTIDVSQLNPFPDNDGTQGDGESSGEIGDDGNDTDNLPDNGTDETTGTIPGNPKKLTSTVNLLNVTLSWEANPAQDNVIRYNIYFNTKKSGSFELIGSTKDTTFKHTALPAATGYYYITATNQYGESNSSAIIEVQR